jgi:Zn finger protein HypA/HybF involved in hydrogenase expression
MARAPKTGKRISRAAYRQACNNSVGWCTTCEQFTRGCTESDAHDYVCPICDEPTFMGAEDAMMSGAIEVA